MVNQIMGFTVYKDIQYPFIYRDKVLYLLPATEEIYEQNRFNFIEIIKELSNFKIEHVWIQPNVIKGITNDEKGVIFITDGIPNNDNGFISFNIKIIYEFNNQDEIDSKFYGLSITGEEINNLANLSSVFQEEFIYDNDDLYAGVTITALHSKENNIKIGSYIYNNIEINLELVVCSFFKFNSLTPLSVSSRFNLEFQEGLNFEDVIKVIFHLKRFIIYTCYRKNVYFEEVIFWKRDETNSIKNSGKIHIFEDKIAELNSDKNKRVIKLSSFHNNVSNIFQAISNNEIYLEHIPNSINEGKSFTVARIILIFAAFEREFANFETSNVKRSEEYIEILDNLNGYLNTLEKEKLNSRKKKYIKDFRNKINYTQYSFGEKVKNAINSNFRVMEQFMNYQYQCSDKACIEGIASRMNKMRNNIAHGNLDFRIDPIDLSDIRILQGLIYAIRLKSDNVEEDEIVRIIKNIIGAMTKKIL